MALLDLWSLFVIHTFGGIFASWLGITLIMILIAWFTKMSEVLMIFLIISFAMVFMSFFIGPVLIMFLFVASLVWFLFSGIQFFVTRFG